MLRQPVLVFESSAAKLRTVYERAVTRELRFADLHGGPLRDGPRRRQPRGRAGGAERGARPRRPRACGRRTRRSTASCAGSSAIRRLPWRCPAGTTWSRSAAACPEVDEGTWFRTPCLRVRKTSFCRMKEDGETLVVKVVDEEDKHALIAAGPEVFSTTPHYDGYAYVLVALARVDRVAAGGAARGRLAPERAEAPRRRLRRGAERAGRRRARRGPARMSAAPQSCSDRRVLAQQHDPEHDRADRLDGEDHRRERRREARQRGRDQQPARAPARRARAGSASRPTATRARGRRPPAPAR